MTKFFSLIVVCAVLAGCTDPLAKVDKLSSIDLADDTATVGVLPDPADVQTPKGLFSGLFGGSSKTEVTPAVVNTDEAVSAALTDATAPAVETVPSAVKAVATPKRGLFGFMRPKEVAVAAAPIAPAAQAAVKPAVATNAQTAAAAPVAAPVVKQEKTRSGLFGMLAGARAKEKAAASEVKVRTASLGPVTAPKRANERKPAFSKRARNHKGPDAQIVPFGSSLPPGVVARVCDLPSGRLGKEVGKFPARGRGYKIFDSKSGASGVRPFYVTGFDDNCARTFTAALAMFGSPTMHEQLRYGLPSSTQPYSTTDKAYEGIKRSVCGVGKKKSCGPKIKLLEKNTAFISMYDRIGSNAQWSNMLLHKGWVLALDRKG